jgi:hypothetical protein
VKNVFSSYQIARSLDLEEQLIEKVRNNRFSIQMGEATHCCNISHLIDYVRYVEDTTTDEDILHTSKELFKIVDDFMKRAQTGQTGCSSRNDGKQSRVSYVQTGNHMHPINVLNNI